jgi:hypothetical protein
MATVGAQEMVVVSSTACPVTIHEVHQVVKCDKMFFLNKEDEKDFIE